jgi:nicotinate dehydrogenase subunit B
MTLPSALPNALPSVLADNPRLDRWLNFAAAGKVELATGRVELGQGVLTAMTQIAAEELDVAFERIIIRSGDTDRTPNEGYTAGSQSMQAGGIALRAACAETRTLFLEEAARRLGCAAAELSVRDGRILRNGAATQFDYWSLAPSVNSRARGDRNGGAQTGCGLYDRRPQRRARRFAGEAVRQCHFRSRHGD